MNRISVASSNLASVGYDPLTLILEIEFVKGAVYEYYGVSQGVFEAIVSASSPGKTFAAIVRGAYDYQEI